MNPGQRLGIDQSAEGNGAVLRYQSDGNLVLYAPGPVWATDTTVAPGYVEMQHDGNLVAYDASGAPYWASGSSVPGARLQISRQGLKIVAPVTVWSTPPFAEPPTPDPVPGLVRPLVGPVRVVGRSFGDSSGPRIVHGCSDFGAIRKYHDDRDQMLRQLDVVAAHQQYVRILWRLNGTLWEASGVTNDPIRDAWFDDAFRGYLQACHDRGLRVNLSSGDFYNWSHQQAIDSFRRVGEMAASVSQDVVWLSAATNEARGTMPGGESDENVRWMADCLDAFKAVYPWALLAGSDPHTQDRVGMKRLAPKPSNVALIHDVRHGTQDALRRTFNTLYENYPDLPVVQDEPTGPEDPAPGGQFTRKVYQPTEDHDALLAIYTMQALTGQAATYFNDPALYSRRPLDETWGFKEIPAAWRSMEMPEHIGQGQLIPGHRQGGLQVVGSNALRADGMLIGNYYLGVISGGSNWKVRSGRDGHATAFTAAGVTWDGDVRSGEVLPISGPTPTVVRIVG